MSIKKSLEKLRSLPVEMRFGEVNMILHYHAFMLKRVRGSHFIYRHGATGETIVCPVHQQKVRKIYLEKILKSLQNYESNS